MPPTRGITVLTLAQFQQSIMHCVQLAIQFDNVGVSHIVTNCIQGFVDVHYSELALLHAVVLYLIGKGLHHFGIRHLKPPSKVF